MKLAKILVSAVLVPALLVAAGGGASDSVQKLLRKPRYGVARIDFADGTRTQGIVSRGTSQFVTLREGKTCRNVELAQIASVKWLSHQDDSLGDTFGLIAMAVIVSPIWVPYAIIYALQDRDESPLRGRWESVPTSNGTIGRIEGDSGNGFMQLSIAVEKGRYEVIEQDLHLAYDRSGVVESIPLQFDCESLVLGDKKLSTPTSTNPARSPIVGRWLPHGDRGSSWEFTASGTFEKRTAESQIHGQIEKVKGGVHVKWLGPNAKPDEDWSIRTKRHHLFITAGGATTEYVRAVD